MAQIDEQDSTSTIAIWPICIALFGIPAIVAAWQGDSVLAGCIATVGIGAWAGFRIGALRVLATVGFVYAALHFVPGWSPQFESLFRDWTGFSGLTNRVTTYATVAFVIGLGIAIAVSVVSRSLFKNGSSADSNNRWVGFFVGAIEGVVAALLFLGGLQLVEPMILQSAASTAELKASPSESDDRSSLLSIANFVSDSVLEINQQAKTSYIGPVLQKYNPYEKFPELNRLSEIQKTIQLVNQPRAVEGLLNSPGFRNLQSSPEIAAAVKAIRSDPNIAEIMASSEPMGIDQVMTVMNSDAVLNLFDQAEFMERAAEIFRESDLAIETVELP